MINEKNKTKQKTEENNRMGKTRDLMRKSEIPKGHFMQRWGQ